MLYYKQLIIFEVILMRSTNDIKQILTEIYASLLEKGYDPAKQIAGYILSEDPVYITDWKNARGKIAHLNRDEILQELIKAYLE